MGESTKSCKSYKNIKAKCEKNKIKTPNSHKVLKCFIKCFKKFNFLEIIFVNTAAYHMPLMSALGG